MKRFPTTPLTYDFSNLVHPLSSCLTPPLTIQNIDWETRDWGQVLKITFTENLTEKAKWNALDYDQPEDLILENKSKIEQGIRREHNWTNIHPDFAKIYYSTNYPYKTYQQNWEENNLTYQDAQAWIPVGFKPNDYKIVKQWKDLSFTPSQVQVLIQQGFQLGDCWLPLTYLHGKGLQTNDLQQPTIQVDYQTWKENLTLQEYLNSKYPTQKEKKQLKEITIGYDSSEDTIPKEQSKLLQGKQLNLAEYSNLEEVLIWGNYLKSKLTELNLSGCSKLVKLSCSNNQLPNLNFLNGLNSEKLTELNIRDNNITSDLNPLRKLVNLEWLYLSNNPFYGSLEPLRGMVKLERLDITDTDLDSGLEYLPESIEYFNCSADKKKDAKCKTIYSLFANEKGGVETDYNERIINFPQKLQEYKQWIKLNFTEEEIKQWINAGFTLSDYEPANQFKQKAYQQNIPIEEIIIQESWQDIHQNFNYQLRKAWEENFTHEETKQLIELGFKVNESGEAKNWKERNFNIQQVGEWISAGLKPKDADYAKQWRDKDFTAEQTQEWISAGAKLNDYEFVAWLRDIKKVDSDRVLNHGNHQALKQEYQAYQQQSQQKAQILQPTHLPYGAPSSSK